MTDKEHWEKIYRTKNETQVSWFQEHAALSLRFIEGTGIEKMAPIIDVGGGASTLVDDLLAAGYGDVSVLDISGIALQRARERLGSLGDKVKWIEADITEIKLTPNLYEVWHDRAVFHFLTRVEDRVRYVQAVRRLVKKGGMSSWPRLGSVGLSGAAGWRWCATAMIQCTLHLVMSSHWWTLPLRPITRPLGPTNSLSIVTAAKGDENRYGSDGPL